MALGKAKESTLLAEELAMDLLTARGRMGIDAEWRRRPGITPLALCLLTLSATGCGPLFSSGHAPGGTDAATSTDEAGVLSLTRGTHQDFFPIGPGSKHADIDCASCHEDSGSFQQFTCISCHPHASDVAATRHAHITEFRYDSKACFNCHPTGWEAPITVKDHSAKYYAIDTGAHSQLLCSDCHTDKSTAKTFSCLTCHAHDAVTAQTQHVGMTDYQYESGRCLACHPSQ